MRERFEGQVPLIQSDQAINNPATTRQATSVNHACDDIYTAAAAAASTRLRLRQPRPQLLCQLRHAHDHRVTGYRQACSNSTATKTFFLAIDRFFGCEMYN